MVFVTVRFETAMALRGGATRLPALRACLRAARRRWRIGALVTCAIWSMVAALAVACLQSATAFLQQRATISVFLAPASGSVLEPALGMFAVAFLVGCVVLCRRAPNLSKFARAADHKLALRERLSTALDVDARASPDAPLDPVRSALLADVEGRAPDIDPRAIVKFGVPRAVWLLPALAIIAVVLHLVPIDAFASRNPVADSLGNNALSQDAAENVIVNLRRIADLLNQDADQRADPYLRTIARALTRLETGVEHASVDRHRLADALDRLLAHSRQAYAQNGKGDRGEMDPKAVDLLAAARDDIAGLSPDRPPTPRRPDNAGAAAPAAAQQAARGATPPASSPSRPRQARPGAAVAPPQSNGAPERTDAQKGGDEYGDLESDLRTQKERAFTEQQRSLRAAVQAVGAAADAGAGEGDRAGNGTRPLGNDAPTRTDLAPGSDMLLPDRTGNNGRRIRIELTPQAELSDVAPPSAGGDRNWRHIGEQPVARSAFDARHRKAVGRYFMPPPESSGR
jgi:hypothetical protein